MSDKRITRRRSGSNDDDDGMLKDLMNIWGNVAVPLVALTTWVGFGVGIIGELDDTPQNRLYSPLTSFVNIIGCTFIGIGTGFFWPITMPLLSLGVMYNKSNFFFGGGGKKR
jgi:hypothetical protein